MLFGAFPLGVPFGFGGFPLGVGGFGGLPFTGFPATVGGSTFGAVPVSSVGVSPIPGVI